MVTVARTTITVKIDSELRSLWRWQVQLRIALQLLSCPLPREGSHSFCSVAVQLKIMPRLVPRIGIFFLLAGFSLAGTPAKQESDSRLAGAFRNPTSAGWTFVHLEGAPLLIGYQHGYLLTPEIEDAKRAIALSVTHEVKHNWAELRDAAEKYFWPTVPDEYRQELQGIAEGIKAHGSKLDVTDLVVMNAFMEFPYYYGDSERRQAKGVPASVGEHCSAFVATGSYTKDGRVVIAHNNWTDYLTGSAGTSSSISRRRTATASSWTACPG